MKITNLLTIVPLIVLVGCGSGDATMTKDEENALVNRSKEIPPEAVEGMSRMGEMMKKQQEANAAAGVDSRGVPLSKSNERGGAPPPAGGQ